MEEHKIVILPQDVINKIAAGEVIHQPFNVVKELFENALDAGATQVEINLENGGFSLIQIIDNGCGISQQDLPNVCLRHSTSKIHQFTDLTSKLSTFGFRGEALFSMSCVSHLSITTKTEDSECALVAHYENGRMIELPEPAAAVNGTIVEVRDLFYNKPEKKRAIPDSNSQNRQVIQIATNYSIAYPQVSIVVKIDGKEKLHTLGGTNTESVLALIYGLTTDSAVFRADVDLGSKVRAQLFLGTIAATRMMKGSAIFVNNRLVRFEAVKISIERVYSEFLKKGNKPFFVVMLTVPPNKVDVNVHPSKKEVNIENSQIIIEQLCGFVRDLLNERIGAKAFKQTAQPTIEASFASRQPPKRKKKDGIEMQIKGAVQSSIITAPSLKNAESSSGLSDEDENDEKPPKDVDSSQNSQPSGFKSRNSIFDELTFSGFGSSKNLDSKNSKNMFSSSQPEPSFSNRSDGYFKKKKNSDDGFNKETSLHDQFFSQEGETNEKDDDFQVDEIFNNNEAEDFHKEENFQNDKDEFDQKNENEFQEEEESFEQKVENKQNDENDEDDESDSICESDTAETTEIKPVKKRRFGLNLQPLSQTPPKVSNAATTAQISKATSKPSNFASQKPTRSSLFDDLKYEPASSKLTRGDPRDRTIEQMFSLSHAMSNMNNANDSDEEEIISHSQYREIDLESIRELREIEKTQKNEDLCLLFSKNIYVGTIMLKYVFFSSDDTLYMCELFPLTRLFFYQLFLRHFGNYGKIKFKEPIEINRIISEFHIEVEPEFNTEAKNEIDYIILSLNSHAQLLDDYFRIRIKDNLIINMPDILPGFQPSFTALGLFLIRLATEIDWSSEFNCIFGILDELAMLYAIQEEDAVDQDLMESTIKMIENVIMPEIKTEAFSPNASLITDRALVRLKSASEMYKIFERT